MEFASPLQPATLLRRYKRFLADVRLADGTETTVHCPNPGAMLGLAAPGTAIWLSESAKKTRKLRHTWELSTASDAGAGTLTGINTGHPNTLVAEAMMAGRIPALAGYAGLRREVAYGVGNRVDLLLEAPDRPPCLVEVKNVHLCRTKGLAEFPDCVTARGAKHCAALAHEVAAGARAVMVYVIQRADAEAFAFAADLDPGYAEAARLANAQGVEMLAVRCDVSPMAITIATLLPIQMRGP